MLFLIAPIADDCWFEDDSEYPAWSIAAFFVIVPSATAGSSNASFLSLGVRAGFLPLAGFLDLVISARLHLTGHPRHLSYRRAANGGTRRPAESGHAGTVQTSDRDSCEACLLVSGRREAEAGCVWRGYGKSEGIDSPIVRRDLNLDVRDAWMSFDWPSQISQ
ncbi:MAG: hypothetical protein JWP89_2618 [Schlesneria sp.]|nr:hypothetical protein [Schlesneria sp.]